MRAPSLGRHWFEEGAARVDLANGGWSRCARVEDAEPPLTPPSRCRVPLLLLHLLPPRFDRQKLYRRAVEKGLSQRTGMQAAPDARTAEQMRSASARLLKEPALRRVIVPAFG